MSPSSGHYNGRVFFSVSATYVAEYIDILVKLYGVRENRQGGKMRSHTISPVFGTKL
jgi:hypothetical protein